MSKSDDLYFVYSPAMRKVKIGRGDSPKRLSAFKTGCPDEDISIIATIPGGGPQERAVQRAWGRQWSHREWFYCSEELLAWIKGECDPSAMPKQFSEAGGMQHNISVRHNPAHVDALIRQMRQQARR